MLDDHIITRLNRNARKQKEYRHIVRGRYIGVSHETAKRIADAFFLRKYAGLSYSAIGKLQGRSRQRVKQIVDRKNRPAEMSFTICHPNKSCM